jgi:hypothetical protein
VTVHSLTTLSNLSATRLTPNGLHSGMDITIQNLEPDIYVYIGAESVSLTDFGYRLNPGSAISFELSGKNALYAIADTAGGTVAVLRTALEIGH